MMNDQFCLKWNNYQASLTSAFKNLLEEEDFVDVTLTAENQTLKAHKVVLSACSPYFRDLLKGINPWQHPVLVLRDVPFLDLHTILAFVYVGEVNVIQDNLQSFLKTAELLQIKGLTEEPGHGGISGQVSSWGGMSEGHGSQNRGTGNKRSRNSHGEISPLKQDAAYLQEHLKRARISSGDNDNGDSEEEVLVRHDPETGELLIEDYDEEGCEEQFEEDEDSNDREHMVIQSDPVTMKVDQIHNGPDNNKTPDGNETEALGPLHKRCPVCFLIMLKKNMSRHIRDQHSTDRPRSTCPLCHKSYKTPEWLKDHVRRGHGYTKELTDELMASMKTGDSKDIKSDRNSSPMSVIDPNNITSLSDMPTDPIMLNPKSIRNLTEK